MLALNKILNKDINRNIDGVIKADDTSHIIQEIEEYVITKEVNKYLQRIIEGYKTAIEYSKNNKFYPYNGVWISGYFGSGKSHLLKVLSYILESKTINNISLKNIFLPKLKDEILKADFSKVLDIPSKSILFNIDQQADAAKSKDEHAILYIFEKVFNKMQGFFGENRNVACFEQDLDESGDLDKFKTFYKKVTGQDWISQRSKSFGLGRTKLIKVLSQLKNCGETEANDLINHYKTSTSLSVESFTRRINEWLDKQPYPQFRLNIFIDEVGQFIANNNRLMLNLQTIAETLNVLCKGRVWIFVTSQEDLNAVVGDPDSKQTYDFSKIRDRFHFRISLSSADVQEVIQKRLLSKTEEGTTELSNLYMNEKENIRTLFTFKQGGKDIHFKDKIQFVLSYPFQAYQYHLLQQALKGLSEHNAFMGRHVSRGERSMLEIFQDVSKSLQNTNLFTFATFEKMFEGIRNTLKTGLLNAVNTAERNLNNKYAIKVLKILLLVKYVKDFKPIHNHLKILLIDTLDMDMDKLNQDIREALNLLERQTYIQRNGDVYEYLTNEEKDIEEEIKNTPVEIDELRKFFSDNIFSGIIKQNKIRYEGNHEDYSFNRGIDGEFIGRINADLTIQIITPFHSYYGDKQPILQQSTGKKELLVFIEPKKRFISDLELYYKTDSYTRQQLGHTTNSVVQKILNDKQFQNTERRQKLIVELKSILEEAEIYAGDQIVSIRSGSALDRIVEGFQSVVSRFYPNLRMIKGHYTEESLKEIIYSNEDGFLIKDKELNEAEKELSVYIQREIAQNNRVILSKVINFFSRNNYGWYTLATLYIIAKLFIRENIELVEGTDVKEKDEVYDILRKNRGHDSIIIRPVKQVSIEQIGKLKKFYQEYFHESITENTGKEVALAFQSHLKKELEEVEGFYSNYNSFPFIESLVPVLEELKRFLNKERNYYLDHIDSYNSLLREKIEIIDPIKSFMKGSQKQIYLEIQNFLFAQQDNLNEMDANEQIEELKELINHKEPYKSNRVKKANDIKKDLQIEIDHKLAEIKTKADNYLEEIIEKTITIPEFENLNEEKQKEVLNPLYILKNININKTNVFSVIRDRSENKGKALFEQARAKIIKYAHPKEKIVYATSNEKKITFNKTTLITEEDVIEYTETLKKHYIKLINENKRIGL